MACAWRRLLLLGIGAGSVAAEPPPGFQMVPIATDLGYVHSAKMNNLGQIVFQCILAPEDYNSSEIFLHQRGELTRLTNDGIADAFPDINDAGDIVWSRKTDGNGPFEIVRLRNGELARITNDAYWDYAPRINESGIIAWHKSYIRGCGDAEADVFLYDGSVYRIHGDGASHQLAAITNAGDLIWTRYDFCAEPWTSEIMVLRNGQMRTLADGQPNPQVPDMNDVGLAAWHYRRQFGLDAIQTWRDGETELLTDWGHGPRLNNSGDIAFQRWHEADNAWHAWVYRGSQFWELTTGSEWGYAADIDERGQVLVYYGTPWTTDLWMLKRLPAGDLNCDGRVDVFDIDSFVTAIRSAEDYNAHHPSCDRALADCNADGRVNNFDIDAFVEILSTSP
ncbi:MAG: hypothetical protein AB7Q17_06385 [Phycisphaerae bacterium]